MSKWTANRDLYLNAAGKQVEADDPAAATLLVRQGRELTAEQVKEHSVRKSIRRAKAEDKAQDKAADKAAGGEEE